MNLEHFVVVVCLSVGLPSCFLSRDTVNEPLVQQRIAELAPGRSTSSDVAQALGAPNEVVQLGYSSAWRYDFVVSKTAAFTIIVVSFVNTDTRADRAWLFFDKDGLLTHVGATLESEGAEYSMPWMDSFGR